MVIMLSQLFPAQAQLQQHTSWGKQPSSSVQAWSCQQGDNTGGGGGGGGVITEDTNTPVVWLSGRSDQSDEEVGNNILSPQQTSQTSPGHQN